MRRLFALILSMLLASLGILVGAAPASAHANIITGAASCQPDGTYTVTWTVKNDYNSPVKVWLATSSPSEATITGIGVTEESATTIEASAGTPYKSTTFTQSGLPGDAGTASVSVKGKWADGYPQGGGARTDSKTISLPAGGCGQDITVKPATICGHDTDNTEWHFVITQTTESQAPASIQVTWVGGPTSNVQLEKATGGTAHYRTTANLTKDLQTATARIAGPWTGQFNVSHGPACGSDVNNPKFSVDQKCASIAIAFTNEDIPAGPTDTKVEAVFAVMVDGGTPETIEVPVNGEVTWSKQFAEDSGSHKVVVTPQGGSATTYTVETDCIVPAVPTAFIVAKCLRAGGSEGLVTLSNGATPQAGQTSAPVTFTVKVAGQDDQEVEVAAGKSATVAFAFPEGTGTKKVSVNAAGMKTVSSDVETDCFVPAVPKATIAATCIEEGGATGVVTLTNAAVISGDQTGAPVTFTVAVEGQAPKAVTVGAGKSDTVDLNLPEGVGTMSVSVTADGMATVTKDVNTDCLVSNPAYSPAVTCGQAVVTFTNDVTTTGDQFAVDATFDVVVDGEGVEKVVVAAKTTETRTYAFGEDTGSHQIVVNDADPIIVETDCLDNTAKLNIAKVVVGASGEQQSTPFDFVATSANGEQTVTVPAGTTTTLDYTVPVEGGLLVSVDETVTAGWHLLGSPVCVQDDAPEGEVATFGEGQSLEQTSTGTVLLRNGEEWTCTFTNEPDGQRIDKSAVVAEGTAVQAGDTITYTVKVSNVSNVETAKGDVVDTLPVGVSLVGGSTSDGGTASADATTITWADVALAPAETRTFNYKVTVNAGYGTQTLVNKVTWLGQSDQTVHPVKGIKVDAIGYCRADAPFYSVNVESQNLPALDPATNKPYQVKVEWLQADASGALVLKDGKPVAAFDPATNQPYVDTYMLDNGKLATGELLWKGAKVDAQGKPIDWPGWDQRADGTWVEVPDGGVRPAAILRVSVNPTLDTVALYPPATPGCNANPPANVSGVEDEVDTPDVPDAVEETDEAVVAGSEDELAKTGGDLGPVLALSLMALVSGAVLFGTGRLAKR